MLPQNAHQIRTPAQQQPGLPSFMPPNQPYDSASYFSLDPAQAAKQMAALSAASQARMANSRPPPLSNASGGTNSAPYLGVINPATYTAAAHDPLPGSSSTHANLQMSNNVPIQNSLNTSFFDSPASQPSLNAPRNPAQASSTMKQHQHNFLTGLANIMAKRGTPLPPALTGVPVPNYDPNTSPFKVIETTSELGTFRLAGKDVDLFKLWGLVFQNGGGVAVTAGNGWAAVAAQFDLPEETSSPTSGMGNIPVAQTLAQYYKGILLPFEEMYKRNIQDQQKKAQASRQMQSGPPATQSPHASIANQMHMMQAPMNGAQPASIPRSQPAPAGLPTSQVSFGSQNAAGPMNVGPQFSQTHSSHVPLQRTSSAALNVSSQGTPQQIPGIPLPDSNAPHMNGSEVSILDHDVSGMKRKMEFDDVVDNKRARQKTEPLDVINMPANAPLDRSAPVSVSVPTPAQAPVAKTRARSQPSRRKIEYVPLAREVETYGGRDLKYIENEVASLSQRRPLRDINDWGTVDIEALTMSLRSRLSTELSYALTTFTLLSTMRGQTPGSGFPIYQTADLFDEMLDLLEEQAFNGKADTPGPSSSNGSLLVSNRTLMNLILESQNRSFASLEPSQGSKDPNVGPRQRPGNIILAIMNIIRNLSIFPDNLEFLSKNTRLIDLLLRVCCVEQGQNGVSAPSSPSLSLNDLLIVRKDALYTLINLAHNIRLSDSAPTTTFRMAGRAFHLISSYLVDPIEAVSPSGHMNVIGLQNNPKPPLLADLALEVFTRLSQTDSNRQVFSKAVPPSSMQSLLQALVHRLPVVDLDFQLMTREQWLSYMEKVVMAIYSLAFFAPPDIKKRTKTDRRLGFKSVMLSMIHKLLTSRGRDVFMVCARRAIEAMKLMDDAEDSFDTSKSATPTMSFGMGYGETTDNSSEKGTGLLGGHRDAAWEMLMALHGDEVSFSEMESLLRVEC